MGAEGKLGRHHASHEVEIWGVPGLMVMGIRIVYLHLNKKTLLCVPERLKVKDIRTVQLGQRGEARLCSNIFWSLSPLHFNVRF